MNKKEVQKRVFQNGKPLALSKFTWREKTSTFSSGEYNLIFDFCDVDNCTFITAGNCAIDTGDNCTFETYWDCTFTTGDNCTFTTGGHCTFETGDNCAIDTPGGCTFETGDNCVIVRRDIFEGIQ